MPRAPLAAALAAVAILAVVLGYREIFSPDIGLHLNSGRLIVSTASLPAADAFVYSAGGHYVDMYWLWQVALYSLVRAGGSFALVASNIAVALAACALLLLRVWRREGSIPAAAAPLLMLFVLGSHWEIRPHVLSWLLLGALLLLLEERERGSGAAVWGLPVVMLVWVQCHSLFVLGLVAIAVHLAAEVLLRRRTADRRFLAAVGLSFLACLVSPNFLEGLRYPIEQYGMLQSTSPFKSAESGISEYQTPFRIARYSFMSGTFVLLQPLFFMHLWTALCLVGVAAGWRRWRMTEWGMLALFGYTFAIAEKNFGYFVVACLPVAAVGLDVVAARLAEALPAARRRLVPIAVCAATAIGSLWFCLQVASGWYYGQQRSPYSIGHRFSPDLLPTRASAFLAESGLARGRMLNNLDAGGYLAWATGERVFIDGLLETFGPDFYREYTSFKDPSRLGGLLKHWDQDVALVPYSSIPQWLAWFEQSAGWRIVYADDRDAVYVRRGWGDAIPTLPPPRVGIDYPAIEPDEADAILDRALSLKSPSPFGSLATRPHYPHRALRLSAFWLMRGEPRPAAAVALDGLRSSTFPVSDLVVNAGHALWEIQERDRARRCYQTLLRPGPLALPASDPLLPALRQRLATAPR